MIAMSAPYEFAYVLVVGVLATYVWRALGVFAAAGMDERGELFRWVRAVSTALVAALVARLILFPQGALALLPVWLRVGAFGLGFAAYALSGRSLILGIVTGEILLAAGALLFLPD